MILSSILRTVYGMLNQINVTYILWLNDFALYLKVYKVFWARRFGINVQYIRM